MAHVDVGSGERPPVLEQEGKVRSERGQERADEADPDSQRDAGHRAAVFGAVVRRKRAPDDLGTVRSTVRPIVGRQSRPDGRGCDRRTRFPDRAANGMSEDLPKDEEEFRRLRSEVAAQQRDIVEIGDREHRQEALNAPARRGHGARCGSRRAARTP